MDLYYFKIAEEVTSDMEYYSDQSLQPLKTFVLASKVPLPSLDLILYNFLIFYVHKKYTMPSVLCNRKDSKI